MTHRWLQSTSELYLVEKSLEALAKKHDVSVDALKKQLEMGIKVEHEHTKDDDKARKIAIDHLEEVPDYYTKLKKVEEDFDIKSVVNKVVRKGRKIKEKIGKKIKVAKKKAKDMGSWLQDRSDEANKQEILTTEEKNMNHNWTQQIRETLSQVLSESKRPTKEDENILKRTQEKEEAEKKRWKDSIKGSGPKKYDEKSMDYALGVHGKYTYDHVEHQGNSLQEEMALNEDLLMLIDVLCEELGIDVDELMEVTAFNDSQRMKNPDILGMERHQLGRLRGLADRVNRGKAKLNNPETAANRLSAIMRARGSNAIGSKGGVFADETNTGGNYYPVKQDTKLSTKNISGNERLKAAEAANNMRKRDRENSKEALARKKSEQKWGAPEGID